MNAVASGSLRQGEAILPRVFGPFETEAVLAYASASADDNPLHVDPALAARVGLARPPIHGMLAMGCLEAYLRDWRSDLSVTKLAAKFIGPVLTGESIEITGKVVRAAPGSPAVLRLTIKREGGSRDLVCLAEAFVVA